MNARTRIADFWDNSLTDWVNGKPMTSPDLLRWQCSYQGKGIGKVDMQHYPDPTVGDIRGIQHEPRLILLGLNPGIGYDSLQSHEGIWTQRIAQHGYTYCLNRQLQTRNRGSLYMAKKARTGAMQSVSRVAG